MMGVKRDNLNDHFIVATAVFAVSFRNGSGVVMEILTHRVAADIKAESPMRLCYYRRHLHPPINRIDDWYDTGPVP